MAGFVPNLYVDVTQVFERKKDALRKLASQPELPERYEIIAKYRGLEAQMAAWMKQCELAEAYCRLGSEAAP